MKIVYCRKKSSVAGLYHPDTGIIELFVVTIKKWAEQWKMPYEEMKELVMYHEEAHHLQAVNGIQFSEEDANGYAWKKFFIRNRRVAGIPREQWMLTSR